MEVWKNAMELTKSVYNILSEIPNDERFGLKSQISRCSVSVPSNIAEGSSRSSNKDYARFLEIAIGSAYEVETQLLISVDLGFLTPEIAKELCDLLEEIIKMTSKFRSTLKT